jgi:sirohydrochlorin ferrochelatase
VAGDGNGFVSSFAVILFAHGSRVESANEGVRAVARDLAQMGSFRQVAPAFLELGQPDLAGAVSDLASQGVQRVVVVPYFLTFGLHIEQDLPQLIAGIREAHPGLEIRVARPLEGHPGLAQALAERARQALID